jgi:LuxR family transcriptional regulator, maltose regulon positive regulatory protein
VGNDVSFTRVIGRAPTGRAPARPRVANPKLIPPRIQPGMLRRGTLCRALDVEARLTVLSAPVGYGKTTLLRSWCIERREPVLWITLDPGDDDTVRLWGHIAAAAEAVDGAISAAALDRLGARSRNVSSAVDELMNGLLAHEAPVTIVLDDLHAIHSRASLLSLEHAIGRLPGNVRLLASSRSDPGIGVARLRARGELTELRAAELAFSIDEAEQLMRVHEIELSPEGLELLVERTEGWPAGLYLAALWLGRLDDPEAGVKSFAGSSRHVADYLVDEVLSSLDPDTRDFLLRTSVLDRFTPELCDAVLDRDDSSSRLAEVASSNLFVVPLDAREEWYRYHHLFRDVLQLELGREQAGELRRRAAGWCQSRGLAEDAIEYAVAAGDAAAVAELLVANDVALVRSGQLRNFLQWVKWLPEELLLEHPQLLAGCTVVAVLLGLPELDVQRLLAVAARVRREASERWTPYAEAIVQATRALLIEDGDVGAAVEHGRSAVAAARADGDAITPGALAALAIANFYAGDRDESRRAAEEALRYPPAGETYVHAQIGGLGVLALLAAEDGGGPSSPAWANEALELARSRFEIKLWPTSLAHCALALVHAGRGELDRAERHAMRAERLRRSPHPTVGHAHTLVVLARVRMQRSRIASARSDLARARQMIDGFADPGCLPELASAIEREMPAGRFTRRDRALEDPSPAELSVLRGLAEGLSRREIAERSFISLNTVKTHIRELYRKLGAGSRTEALVKARAFGLLAGEAPDHPGDRLASSNT